MVVSSGSQCSINLALHKSGVTVARLDEAEISLDLKFIYMLSSGWLYASGIVLRYSHKYACLPDLGHTVHEIWQ